MNAEFEKIVNNLEAVRVNYYNDLKEIFGGNDKQLEALIDKLGQPGYMRHVANKDVIIYNEIEKLKGTSVKAIDQKRAKLISKLGEDAKFFEQK